MRRWNGWGDDATTMELSEGARAMMATLLGPGRPGQDAQRAGMVAKIPPSRLSGQRALIQTDADTRFAMALGESFADWIRKRFGALPPAVSSFIFAERFNQEPEKVASIVMIGNASALFFIPLALALRL